MSRRCRRARPALPVLLTLLLALSAVPARADERLVAGLADPGTAPPSLRLVNPFNLYYAETVRGGLSVGSTCINYQDPSAGGPNGGIITISDIPAGATVLSAFVYYIILSDTFPVPTGAPTFNGVPLTPIPLGSVPRSPCFPETVTGTFRMDVTSLVPGNGSYAIGGLPGNGGGSGDITEGATLFVIWCDPASPLRDIVLWEGTDVVNQAEPTFSQDITGFLADPAAPPQAFLGAAFGNGQMIVPGLLDGVDPVLFNGTDLDAIHPEILSGAACTPPGTSGFYDNFFYDVSPYVSSGATSANVSVTLNADCYTFAALALAVTTDQNRPDDACIGAGCGRVSARVDPPVSCDGSDVLITLDASLGVCPAGPREEAVQATNPITANNGASSSDLAPATVAAAAAQASLTWDLTGDTNLTDCVEIALIDPSGTPSIVKAAGAASAPPVDVTALYTGPGTWQVRLAELDACGGNPNRFATLATSVLTVWEQTGLPAVEYRVEDMQGVPLCDWGRDNTCSARPPLCPGEVDVTGLARCTFDPSCVAQRVVQVVCSGLLASFESSPACPGQPTCFTNRSTGGLGAVTWLWDFAGQGSDTAQDPCFTFSGPGPWDVALTATDGTGCVSRATVTVPPGGGALVEPSALDVNPAAEPFRVSKSRNSLRVQWEDLGAGTRYDLYRGRIGNWYSHGSIGVCGINVNDGIIPNDPGSFYFLVTSACTGAIESSYGRSSAGAERPTASVASGAPCP